MALIKTVIALGMFDGAHIGHKEILNTAKECAEACNGIFLATTFSDDFAKKRFKSTGLLFDEAERISMLKESGAKNVIVFPADEPFLNMDADDFLDWLNDHYAPSVVVAGSDFTYGRDRVGNSESLKAFFREKNVEVFVVPLKNEFGEKVSTSAIKTLLTKGETERANHLLGRHYFVTGTVVEGRRDGTKNGVPTANIALSDLLIRIKDGVYESRTTVDSIGYPSITNIGSHPTYGDERENIETNLIGFEGNLYGKKIKVEFIKRMRDIKRFASEEELYRQIRSDIEEIKNDQIRSCR